MIIKLEIGVGDTVHMVAREKDGQIIFDGILTNPYVSMERGKTPEIRFQIEDFISISGKGTLPDKYVTKEKGK